LNLQKTLIPVALAMARLAALAALALLSCEALAHG